MNLLQRICPTVLQSVPASNSSGFATVALVCLGCLSLVSLAQADTLQFANAAFSKLEGNSGSSNATITVSRTGVGNGAIEVTYATSDGTATAGSDYTAKTSVCKWKDDRAGAFLLMFDDGHHSQVSQVIPNLHARDMIATFYVPTAWITVSFLGDSAVILGNHSKNHQQLSAPTYEAAKTEQIDPSQEFFRNNAAGNWPRLISFARPGFGPEENWWLEFAGGWEENAPDFIRLMDENNLIKRPPFGSARAGGSPASAQYGYITTANSALAVADLAINDKKMEYIIFHNIEIPGVTAIPFYGFTFDNSEFIAFLDGLKTRMDNKQLWITDHISYHQYEKQRESAVVTTLEYSDTRIRLTVTDGVDDILYNQPLTMKTEVPSGWTNVRVTQNNITTDRPVVNGIVRYDVKSNGAEVTLSPTTVSSPGSIQFSSATYTHPEGNTGTTLATITATRTGGSSGAVSVSYATGNGTATAGSDYTAASGLLTWDEGETGPKNFTISIIGDTTTEADETVNLTLSNPTGGATLGTPATAVLTITNDDASSGATRFWKGTGTWTDANSWSLSSGGSYNQTWVSGDAAVFDVAGSTITGATTNFSSITANESVILTAGGTLGTGGTAAIVTVAATKTLNTGSQTWASNSGFIKNGAGLWVMQGGSYTGNFTMNAGTIAMANINALGGTSATRTLTLNGGTIRSNGTTVRDLGTRFGGGIIIGGDMILGAAAPTEGAMSFGNNVTLGAATRQIATEGTVTLSGIISGDPGAGITKAGAGTLTLSNANTYTGPTTVNTGTLVLAAGSSTSAITVKDGAFLGFTIGSSITSNAALTLETGAKIRITGAPTLASYTLFTASGITGSPVLETAIPGYALVKDGSTLKLNAVTDGYSSWSASYAGGQTPELDWDNDGMPNGIEYFINPAAGFTANPAITGANTITWPNGGNIPASAYGTRFAVQTSTNLQSWTDVPANQLTTNTDGPGGALTYTITSPAPLYIRLKVTP